MSAPDEIVFESVVHLSHMQNLDLIRAPAYVSVAQAITRGADDSLTLVGVPQGQPTKYRAAQKSSGVGSAALLIDVDEGSASVSGAAVCQGIDRVFALIPTETDSKYVALKQQRMHQAVVGPTGSVVRNLKRTVVDEGLDYRTQDVLGSKLFQIYDGKSELEDQSGASGSSGRLRTTRGEPKSSGSVRRIPPVLPQISTSVVTSPLVPQVGRSADEAVLSVFTKNDSGLPLYQIAKLVKANGVTLSTVDLKAKLQEVAVYERRDVDQHPKYYLRDEYKDSRALKR